MLLSEHLLVCTLGGGKSFNLIAVLGPGVDALLVQLGLAVGGNVGDRKRLFTKYIGLMQI